MKYNRVILLSIILFITLFFTSCGKGKRLKSNGDNDIKVNFKENSFYKEIKIDEFYLNLLVPKSWYILSDQERNNLFIEVLDRKGVYSVFSIFEENINNQSNTDCNANLYIAAENISITENTLTLDEYVEKLFKDIENNEISERISFGPIKKISLDEKDARKSIIKISHPNMDIEQEYNFITYKDYIYVFVSTYSNEVQKESLKKIIKSIKLN